MLVPSPGLPPPSVAFADEQTPPDDWAEHASSERQPYVVVRMGDHDVVNGIRRGGKDEMSPCEPKLHNRLLEATWWERAKGIPAQRPHHLHAPKIPGRSLERPKSRLSHALHDCLPHLTPLNSIGYVDVFNILQGY